MISIVIPVYNKEQSIKETLNSVFKQSYEDFELIIVDDGSKDSSKKIIESFNDRRIKLYSIENSGVSNARNYGVTKAKYDYVAFLDADDYWHPMYLSIMNSLIKEDPGAVLYFSNYEKVKGKICPPYITNEELKIIKVYNYFDFISKNYAVTTSSVIVNRKFYNIAGGFNPKYNRGEDLELWTKMAFLGHFSTINLKLSYYNINVQNSLTKKSFAVEESFANDAEEFKEKYTSTHEHKNGFERYMNRLVLSKCKYFLKDDPKQARKISLRVLFSKTNILRSLVIIVISYFPKSIREFLMKV